MSCVIAFVIYRMDGIPGPKGRAGLVTNPSLDPARSWAPAASYLSLLAGDTHILSQKVCL